MNDTKKMIGQIVHSEIKEKSSTFRQFAEKVGMKHPQVHKILRGQQNYTIDTLLKLLDALDLEIVIQKKKR